MYSLIPRPLPRFQCWTRLYSTCIRHITLGIKIPKTKYPRAGQHVHGWSYNYRCSAGVCLNNIQWEFFRVLWDVIHILKAVARILHRYLLVASKQEHRLGRFSLLSTKIYKQKHYSINKIIMQSIPTQCNFLTLNIIYDVIIKWSSCSCKWTTLS